MNLRVNEAYYFDCPYCGKTASLARCVDEDGTIVDVVTHVLPHCDRFELETGEDFAKAASEALRQKLN